MECSCKLCPTPGMYVVTSIEFVRRTRATLRSAEFGFLGVCVYTRMQTPRFSGQPINAGDLVLTWTCSRPIRTSCENVGTVISLNGAHNFPRLSQGAHKNARERSPMLKGLLRIRRYQQETPRALQEADVRSWLRFGEAYSALRDWRPIPAALLSHSVVQCSGTEEFLPTTTAILCGRPRRRRDYSDKQRSIRKKTCSVKLSSKQACENERQNRYFGPGLACRRYCPCRRLISPKFFSRLATAF